MLQHVLRGLLSGTMPVRFTPDETKAIEAAARASKQTVSEWIRSMLEAAIQ